LTQKLLLDSSIWTLLFKKAIIHVENIIFRVNAGLPAEATQAKPDEATQGEVVA